MDLVLEWFWRRDLAPAGGQTGTKSTATAISWGTLTGWSQTGILVCPSQCLMGDCDTACLNFVGFAGTGAIAPLLGGAIDPGTWTFTGPGAFAGEGFPIVELAGGAVTESLALNGTPTAQAPLAPLAGVGALATGLAWLGGRRLRRRPSSARTQSP